MTRTVQAASAVANSPAATQAAQTQAAVYRDNSTTIKWVVAAVAIIVVGVLAYLLYKFLKPVGDTAKDVAKTADVAARTALGLTTNAGQAAVNATSGLPKLGQAAGDLTGNLGDLVSKVMAPGLYPVAQSFAPSYDTASDVKKNVAIVVDDHWATHDGWSLDGPTETHHVQCHLVDAITRQPVGGTIECKAVSGLLAFTGDQRQLYTAGGAHAEFNLTTLFSINHDVTLVAHPLNLSVYNPDSAVLTVYYKDAPFR